MLRRFARNERGVAAVEFAMIAPIMAAVWLGMTEFSMAMMAERRASHAASVVADLVAQSSQMNQTQVTDIFEIADAIMKPFPSSGLTMRVSSVRKASANTAPSVVWSRGDGLAARTAGAGVDGFPADLLLAGDSVIMAEVAYTYRSPLQSLLPDPLTWTRTFYLRPRRVSEVAWVSG